MNRPILTPKNSYSKFIHETTLKMKHDQFYSPCVSHQHLSFRDAFLISNVKEISKHLVIR